MEFGGQIQSGCLKWIILFRFFFLIVFQFITCPYARHFNIKMLFPPSQVDAPESWALPPGTGFAEAHDAQH